MGVLIEFRLNSEGSNDRPYWGMAFRHADDMAKALDLEMRPSQIDVEFPDGELITFGIRPSFWRGCHEFVDAQAIEKSTGLNVKPIRTLAVEKLGYTVETKKKCRIVAEVIERNRLLRITTFI